MLGYKPIILTINFNLHTLKVERQQIKDLEAGLANQKLNSTDIKKCQESNFSKTFSCKKIIQIVLYGHFFPYVI